MFWVGKKPTQIFVLKKNIYSHSYPVSIYLNSSLSSGGGGRKFNMYKEIKREERILEKSR